MDNNHKNVESFKNDCGHILNDIWYPRVTKIVDIKAKPALYRYYAAAKSYDSAEKSKNMAAEEGTMVHEVVEKILLGENPIIPLRIAPSIKAFLEFIEINHVQTEPDFIERRIQNDEHRYSGTIDAMALIHGKFGVLDIKTSQAIYRDYNLQTSAYMAALKPDFNNLETRWILRIDQERSCKNCEATLREKGGSIKIRFPWPRKKIPCPVSNHNWCEVKGIIELKEFTNWENDFNAFLGAKKLWEWENEFWLKEIGYI